jgi:alkaline phosphatase D
MRYFLSSLLIMSLGLFSSTCKHYGQSKPFISYWKSLPDRYWTGPEFWANRLQDWQIHDGRVECINGWLPNRTLHILDRYMSDRTGSVHMEVTTGLIKKIESKVEQTWSGFLIGAGTADMDYRKRALIHGCPGNEGGLIVALDVRGDIRVINNEDGSLIQQAEPVDQRVHDMRRTVMLSLELEPGNEDYLCTISAIDVEDDYEINHMEISLPNVHKLDGNLALISNGGTFWFKGWHIHGSKVQYARDQQLGPVIGTQYTISDRKLKLTAQLAPISESDEQTAILQLLDRESGKWKQISTSQVIVPGYTATFRVPDWDAENAHDYRVQYHLTDRKESRIPYYYYGVIVRDPADKDEIVVAAFTGNSNSHGNIDGGEFDFANRIWFPHEDLTSYVAKHAPDLLVYTGDNVYEGRPTPPDFSSAKNTELDYLYKWYLFLWAHGGLTRNIPAVTIPDDHDVYHGNLWGAGGVKAPAKPADGKYPDHYHGNNNNWQQDQGGYKLSPDLVNMIERTQTSHLPDPHDPAPVAQGIGVYFCNLNYGRISWAVLEDRKFKSAPGKIHPEYRIVNGFSQVRGINGKLLDSPDAILMGSRQISFVRDWAADWKGVDMKVAISQTIFANLSTYPDTFLTDASTPRLQPLPWGVIPKDYSKARDMDSNGWPQTGRNKILRELRKGFALMIGGDQHLGSVIHHGIDAWEDAGYSFCVPSIANLWPRRWFPQTPGEHHQPGMPLYTGRYFDGFGNRITVLAVSNPYISGKEPSVLHDRAPGYGIIRLNKKSRLITLECWPRYADPEPPDGEQYPGWPVTLDMEDNYSREAVGWLPPLYVTGLDHPPVVQVVNEITGETIYTLRIRGFNYQPGIFAEGIYTLHIGEPGTPSMQSLTGLLSATTKEQDKITLTF